MLFLVATPIGNLSDVSFRAIETLKEVDLIIAEDTRHTKILLKHFEIDNKIDSLHSFSKEEKILHFVKILKEGKKIAMVSDAGTPTILDPGYNLVKRCYENNVSVCSIPGACALTVALSASPFPKDKFLFLGFLPVKKGRQTIFETIVNSKNTVVFYESKHRIERTLKTLAEKIDENRLICVARELTKIHEEFTVLPAKDIITKKLPFTIKGEFVVMLAPSNFELNYE